MSGYFEKDTAGATGELAKVIEVVVDSPEQAQSMMTFQEFELVLGARLNGKQEK